MPSEDVFRPDAIEKAKQQQLIDQVSYEDKLLSTAPEISTMASVLPAEAGRSLLLQASQRGMIRAKREIQTLLSGTSGQYVESEFF